MRYISYRRVSKEDTKRLMKRGIDQSADEVVKLGLQAQQKTILKFVADEEGEIIADYHEIMSGGIDERPELLKALAFAKKHKACLVVSKLDRLSRDAAFILDLIKREVKFVVAEFGHDVDPMMLQMYAVLAEKERKMIGQRTKDALAVLKDNGVRLGNQTNLAEAGEKGRATHAKAASQRRANIMPIVREIQSLGFVTLDAIATQLNKRGVKTARGSEWHKTSVSRLLSAA